MSAWTKFRNTAAVAVGTYFGGAAGGAVVSKYQEARAAQGRAKNMMAMGNTYGTHEYIDPNAQPGVKAGTITQILPGVGRVAGKLGGSISLRAIYASAMSYCRRHPAWCSAIGITGVVELITSGSLPPMKRRRRKGISASDLSKFRRVAGFLYKWGPMCQSTPKPRRAPARRA